MTIKYGTSVDENEEVWTSDTKDDDGLYVYNEEYSGKQNLTKKYKVRSERLRAVIAQRKVIEDNNQKMLEKWTNDRRRSGQTESKMKASDWDALAAAVTSFSADNTSHSDMNAVETITDCVKRLIADFPSSFGDTIPAFIYMGEVNWYLAGPVQCARAASVRPVAPGTAGRGQPSNVLL